MRILVVEDNDDTATANRLILEGMGHEVTRARDEGQALAILMSREIPAFDLVVADWRLDESGLPGGGTRVARLAVQCGMKAVLVSACAKFRCERDVEMLETIGVPFRRKPFEWPALLHDVGLAPKPANSADIQVASVLAEK